MPWLYNRRAARARLWAHVRFAITLAVIWMLVEAFAAGVILATLGPIAHDAWERIAEAFSND